MHHVLEIRHQYFIVHYIIMEIKITEILRQQPQTKINDSLP